MVLLCYSADAVLYGLAICQVKNTPENTVLKHEADAAASLTLSIYPCRTFANVKLGVRT